MKGMPVKLENGVNVFSCLVTQIRMDPLLYMIDGSDGFESHAFRVGMESKYSVALLNGMESFT